MAPKAKAKAKGRGGVKQRLGITKALREKARRTTIGEFLVSSYKAGNMTSRQFREGARAASSSAGDLTRVVSSSMDKIRMRRGKAKPDTRSDSRTVNRFLKKKHAELPEPYIAEVPVWDDSVNAQVLKPLKVYPPHESLDSIVKPGCEEEWSTFDDSQSGFRESLQNWSSRVQVKLGGPWLCLALWGDSAPFNKRDSLYLLTYRVLNGQHRRRVWIAGLSKRMLCACGCFGRHTFDALFDIVAWSMRALLSGTWPTRDHRGRAFAQSDWRARKAGQRFRFGAALIAKCGDWSWHKQILGLRGWQDLRPCWLCRTTLGDRDFSSNAMWRNEPMTMALFLASASFGEQYLSRIFSIPGFELSMVLPDWMHTVCLGILQYLEGNVMYECFILLGGRPSNKQEVVSRLFQMVCVVAMDMGLEKPFSALTYTMFKQDQKKARMRTKATEGRRFLPILIGMLQRFFPCDNERGMLVLQCCQAMCRCYLELRNWTADSPIRLERAARQHLLLYCQLGDLEEEGSIMWRIYPKHHLLCHVSMTKTNPALLWNYADEDEIGKAACLARRCNPKWLHVALLERYRVL